MSATCRDDGDLAPCHAPTYHEDLAWRFRRLPNVLVLHARHGIKRAVNEAALAILANAALQAANAEADVIHVPCFVLAQGAGICQRGSSHRDQVRRALLEH